MQTSNSWSLSVLKNLSPNRAANLGSALLAELNGDSHPSITTIGTKTEEDLKSDDQTHQQIFAIAREDLKLPPTLVHEVETFFGLETETIFAYIDERIVNSSGFVHNLKRSEWDPYRFTDMEHFGSIFFVNWTKLISCLSQKEIGIQTVSETIFNLSPEFPPKRIPSAVVIKFESTGPSTEVSTSGHTQIGGVSTKRQSHRISSSSQITVVIPTGGFHKRVMGETINLLQNCLESLNRVQEVNELNFCIVTNTLTEKELSKEIPKSFTAPHQIISDPGTFNFSRMVNLAVANCPTEFIFLLNDDTEAMTQHPLDSLRQCMEDQSVAAVAPILRFPTGSIQSAGHYFDRGVFNIGRFQSLKAFKKTPSNNWPHQCSGLSFAAVLLRKSVFELLGGLSLEFPNSYNDVDFCNKARWMGYKLMIQPDVEFNHFESASRSPVVTHDDYRKIRGRWQANFECEDDFFRFN